MAVKHYHKIKSLMFEKDITQEVLCKHLHMSRTAMTHRMTGRQSWELSNVYRICDLLGVDYKDISVYFPPNDIVLHTM